MIGDNLLSLRKLSRMTQEEAAARVGVSRQALAKWESGETLPDIEKCQLLAQIYGVSLDELVNLSQAVVLPDPPKGKHIFGIVTVGDKGQIVIPRKARSVFGIAPGDRLVVLGDESQGIALIKERGLLDMMNAIRHAGEEKP